MIKEVEPQVDNEVVEILERALERAKQGKTQSVGIVEVYSDATTGNVFSTYDPVALLGESVLMSRDITDVCVSTRCHDAGMNY